MARLSNPLINKPRDRETVGRVACDCINMSICDRKERNTARCGKNRCSCYKDPRNPKNRR